MSYTYENYIRGLQIHWSEVERGSYLWRIPAISHLDGLGFHKPVTLFCGENGTGKSTLLEAIAIAYGFNPEGGTMNFRFSTFDDFSPLYKAMTLIKSPHRPLIGYFFRAETFFNVATKAIDYSWDHSDQYHVQSHGESFMDFLQTYQDAGLFLMDEPEAALSPQHQLSLLLHIADMARTGSQFLIATHSPILLGIPNAEILSFDGSSITPCAYEDTESYKVTELFLNHREQVLRSLFREEGQDRDLY